MYQSDYHLYCLKALKWKDGRRDIFPVSWLMDRYEKSIGRNANLIIGLTPDADGLIPQPDADTLKGLGELLKAIYGKPLFSFSSERVRAFSVQVKQKGKRIKLSYSL